MTKSKYQAEAEKVTTELSEAQTQLRRTQAQVKFLGDTLASRIERFHSLRIVHGDCNASMGFTAIQQEMDAINAQLNAIAAAEIVG